MKRWIAPFIKSIAVSAVVCAIGLAITSRNRIAGVMFLALYSTFMVVKSFRRPIPLGFLTAVLPGLTALGSYIIQLSVIDFGTPDLPLAGLLAGIIPGIIMGIVHRTYIDNGRLWARKSFWYLVLWGISYIAVQGAALAGAREISGGALALSGFTSSGLVMLSFFLFCKYIRGKRKLLHLKTASITSIFFVLISILALAPSMPTKGRTENSSEHNENVKKSVDWLELMEGRSDDFVVDPDYYIPGGDDDESPSDEKISEEVVAAGVAGAVGQMLIAAIMAALMSGTLSGGASAAAAGIIDQALNEVPVSGPELTDPDNDTPLEQKNGRYLVWGKWVDYDEARRWIMERKAEQAERSAGIERRFAAERNERQARSDAAHRARGDRYDGDSNTWYSKEYDDARLAAEYKTAQDKLHAAMLEKNRNHAADRLRKMLTKEGKDPGTVDDLIASGQWDELCDMFRDRVYQDIKDSVQAHAYERRWAVAHQVAEYSARVVESAAKAGIAVLAGPATGGSSLAAMGAAAGATGAIAGAGEGTSAYFDAVKEHGQINSGNWSKIVNNTLKGTTAGFLSGAKDGAVGVYCGGPGVSKTVKVLLPAGCDAAETYLRTGDIKKAGTTGALSIVGDLGGDVVDKIGNRFVKEAAGTAWSGAMGGAGSYVNGGDFGEGVITALVNRTGSRMGGDLVQGVQESRPVTGDDLSDSYGAEGRLRKAIDETSQQHQDIIPLKDQPEVIRDLWDSRKTVVSTDPVTGAKKTVILLDEEKAFNQLADTASSRSAKLADPEVQQAILDTRKKIIDPANEATIARVIKKPEMQNLMQEGDRLVMTSYSTPGSEPRVGADRDAIMCIARPIEGTDRVQLIQVDRRLWQNEAYDEFYKHTSKYARTDADGNITPETEPEFHRQKQALAHLRKRPLDQETIDRVRGQVQKKVDAEIEIENRSRKAAGMPVVDTESRHARIDALVNQKISRLNSQFLTDDQINARAWAASRNQVFTDPYHMEASRDNSNQVLTVITTPDGKPKVVRAQTGVELDGTVRPIVDAEGKTRTGPGVLEAQKGLRDGLIDPEGSATMWKVKPDDYIDGNIPEAVAQGQKGIKQFMKIREGQRRGGYAVPPLNPHVSEAMEALVRTPVDSTSSPQRIQELEAAIKAIRKPDPTGRNPDGIPAYPGGIKEALEKLPEQNRMLKAAMSGQTTITVHQDFQQGPQTADDIRSAMRDGISNPRGPQTANNPPSEPTPPEPDELEERIRKLDEERARLAKKIAERNRGKGENS
ncbi:MAG: hypothetical protein JXL81_06960 [Deltaproteobacteria bacterium]|nr:hypothetical protein [Deltaproteobacteria bacterium]